MIAIAAVLVCCVAPARAGADAAPPLVAACASTRLPPAILNGPEAPPAKPLALVSGTRGPLTLHLAVADDDATRELGLMCVTRLQRRGGMIFVFPNTTLWTFWMKNTLIPLDMLWLDADGTITTVAANVPAATRETPDSAVARRAGHGRFVIELTAGEAAADWLRVGDRLSLPALRAQ